MPGRLIILSLFLVAIGAAIVVAEPVSQELDSIMAQARARTSEMQGPAFHELRSRIVGPAGALNLDPNIELIGILPSGLPVYLGTHNLIAAGTVNVDDIWPGGVTGFDLTGACPSGELAIWDAGIALTTHQELRDRIVVGDGTSGSHAHSTHVAGTMIAAGVNSRARGMSYEANLVSYSWSNDSAEMAFAARGDLLLSNHSYGQFAGWQWGLNGTSDWYWFGDTQVSEVEDVGFGFYSESAAEWDAIAHAAPEYLIVKSAGNNRDDYGPGPGGQHFVWSPDQGDWVRSTVTRPADGGTDGFDSIAYKGNAKNILTVGAVHDIPGGWTSPADVVISAFTSWGPTDDGRIKPDLVANGVEVFSPVNSSNSAYDSASGTSISAPSACGTLNLLVQHYQTLMGGDTPRASTVKALAIHTANEAGPARGPDYMFGWGLMDARAAAEVIVDHATHGLRLIEYQVALGAEHVTHWYHDGEDPLVVTVVWTDPAGPVSAWELDPEEPRLVNDLGVRLIRDSDGTVFHPWTLNPALPQAPAIPAVNHRDNVEKIDASGATAGFYTVVVDYGSGESGNQAFSLVQTGLETTVSSIDEDEIPSVSSRLRAAPNPFNPRTTVAFTLDTRSEVDLGVYDARGRRLTTLVKGPMQAGDHSLTWDGHDDQGRRLAAGVYLLRLETAGRVDHLRVSLIK